MNLKILSELNLAQREAVEHIDGPMLILAGAGSGKTKTLTTRLAYLIDEVGIPSVATLTLTFTNKAAHEMRLRALSLIENSVSHPPLLCTFHKFGLLFLKFYIHHLGRNENFILIDNDDRKKILRSFAKSIPLGVIDFKISQFKNLLISPQTASKEAKDPYQKQIAHIYQSYNAFLENKNMVDFDDLLYLSYVILDTQDELAQEISTRYQYIMVDEYQDTNYLQYKLLRKFCGTHQNLCVVGDDDQSIYGWRGADISNILEFGDNFENVKIVKLEENYRSTSQILKVANSLIAHNSMRLGKKLQSNKGDGKEVEILYSIDEKEESAKVADKIKKLIEQGEKLDDIAILFRLNALSRSIEEGLNRAKIPYKLIGAMRFYERAEIKDILSYLRLILNPNDDFSLSRIINKPRRGIGKVSEDKIFKMAQSFGISAYEALKQGHLKEVISEKNHNVFEGLFLVIEDLRIYLEESSSKIIDELFARIDIVSSVEENSNDNVDRVSNIQEFHGLFRDYFFQSPANSLQDFLNDLSLSSDVDTQNENFVSCMSAHSAKGLEFKYVFITGFEDGFFPLIRDEGDIEEERRLGYVAFTRAKDELYISYVDSRFYKGKRARLERSSFIKEAGLLGFGGENIKDGDLSFQDSFKQGDLVVHKIFGTGRVVSVQGKNKDARLRINFGGMQREILVSFIQRATNHV